MPLPIVLSRKYFPIFICRFDWCDDDKPVRWLLFEVIVDLREWVVDDKGEADTDDVGEFSTDNSGGIGRGTEDNGDPSNI